jgi:NAD(P)-dependent dehydrogenase (short-subunit alcohol dehydrogenase family)
MLTVSLRNTEELFRSEWKGREMVLPQVSERTVIVTGGAQGIGLAYARRFSERGYPVAIFDIDESVIATARAEAGAGRPMIGLVTDVADQASVDRAVSEVEITLGPASILVNNAALFVSLPLAGWEGIDVDLWDRVMAVNLRGPFVCAKRVLPGMYKAGAGRIINISSSTAHMGGYQRLHYVTSKAGIIGFTRALAKEVGQAGITINAVAPGSTQSEGVLATYSSEVLSNVVSRRAIPRPELPEDLVGVVMFLASDEAAFITGQTIIVDGGHVFL